MNHDELIPLVLASAAAAAGPNPNAAGWRNKVMELIPPIAAMMNDSAREWQAAASVLDAGVFPATYLGYELEESSTRCLVKLDSGKPTKNYPDGIEPIRSHRTDGPMGRSMRERLDKLTKGDRILVWKALEPTKDGEKVRVLAHLAFLGHGETSERAAPSGDVTPRAVPDEPPVDSPSDSPHSDDVQLAIKTFDELAPRVKAQAAKALREAGLQFPTPADNETERWFSIIDEVVGS